MKPRTLLTMVAMILAAGVIPAAAKKASVPSVTHLPFWTVKGRPTPQFVPGLTAALLLTLEQQEQLTQAWQETMGSEAVAAAARTLKSDPDATAAQKEAARSLLDAAAATLQLRINAILTMDQKALIEWINSVFVDAGKAVAAEMEAEYAAAKGDKAAIERVQQKRKEKLETAFLQKLKEILTPEQWTAMMRAAEEEKGARGAGKGKGDETGLKAPSPEAGKKRNGEETELKPTAPGS
jgi:hypothetical protein